MSPSRLLLALALVSFAACKAGTKSPAASEPTPEPVPNAPADAPVNAASSAPQPKPEAPLPDEGLLLGLRNADGKLQTVFIDGQSIEKLGPGLAIRRDTGWWKVQVREERDASGNNTYATLYAHAAGKAAPPPYSFEELEECETSRDVTVLFANENIIAINDAASGYCPGAAHPYAVGRLRTLSLNDLSEGSTGFDIDEVLGDAAKEKLEKTGVAEMDDECLAEPTAGEWGLVRRRGAWIARARLNYAYEACRSTTKDFTVPVGVPTTLTGDVALPVAWSDIKMATPSATDAAASPSGAFLVIVTPDGLSLKRQGNTVAEFSAPGESIVMTQWATSAADVRAWRKDAAETLK